MEKLHNEVRVHIKINQEVKTDIFRIGNLHHKQSPSQGRNGRLNQWGSEKAEPHLAGLCTHYGCASLGSSSQRYSFILQNSNIKNINHKKLQLAKLCLCQSLLTPVDPAESLYYSQHTTDNIGCCAAKTQFDPFKVSY